LLRYQLEYPPGITVASVALSYTPCGAALGPVKISTEYLAQIETAISIIYGKYVYTYGYLR
jgi:hypothetical protein